MYAPCMILQCSKQKVQSQKICKVEYTKDGNIGISKLRDWWLR